ncbi:MAG: hypothetical protein JW838_07290 [Spirochaetes bacterium]|nr:hypothetical protein [Spirochaetota bacterium]
MAKQGTRSARTGKAPVKASGSGRAKTKAAASKTKKRAKSTPPPKRDKVREALIVKIMKLAETLGADSLKKLLNDATILAHNERVLAEFRTGREKARPAAKALLAGVDEGKDGTYFMVNLKGHRHIFGIGEMRNLVRLCHGVGSAKDAGPSLYSWFERARRDILKNSKITDSNDPSLPALWKKIVSAYRAKD